MWVVKRSRKVIKNRYMDRNSIQNESGVCVCVFKKDTYLLEKNKK